MWYVLILCMFQKICKNINKIYKAKQANEHYMQQQPTFFFSRILTNGTLVYS